MPRRGGQWPDWLAATLCGLAGARGCLATVEWLCTCGNQHYGDFSPTDCWETNDVLSLLEEYEAERVAEEGKLGARTRELADRYVPIDSNYEVTMDAVECAAEGGHLHVVEYLCRDAALRVTPAAAGVAAASGFVDVAMFLLRRGVFAGGRGINAVLLELAGSDGLTPELAQRTRADGIGRWSPQFVSELLEALRFHSSSPLVPWLRQMLPAPVTH